MAAALEASQPLFHAAQLSLTATGAAPRRGKQALIVPKEWSEQTSRSAFHLRQVSVMFALHKRPCSSDPRVRRGEQSGHTSSISGDHRGCCAAWSREPSGWTDWNSSGCGCSGSAEGWQQLLCADVKPPTHPSSLLPVNHRLQISHKPVLGRFMGPPPFYRPSRCLSSDMRAPLFTSSQCLPFCALWPSEDLWSGSSGVECAKHTRLNSGREETTDFHFFFWVI